MKNDIVPQKPSRPGGAPQLQDVRRSPFERPAQSVSRPSTTPQPKQLGHDALPPITIPEPEDVASSRELRPAARRGSLKKILLVGLGVLVLLFVGLIAFYFSLLNPKDASATQKVSVEIVSGMLPAQIADTLEQKGVIRSSTAFRIYIRLSGIQNRLQAGNYQLSASDSTPAIAKELEKGPASDEIEVLFRPGETLADSKKTLLKLGYSSDEISEAFTAQYDHPLFVDRPTGSDLEGYIFGETHRFLKGTPIKKILERYFDDYYAVVKQNDLIEKYKQRGLSLYQGITLASIIQRESGGEDKAQIAQVFLLRLSDGMPLGSDVTYQYIADKEGKPRDVNYNSPYNTRRFAGLPPGPIASPGVAALQAVANPAEGNYIYFLSGDDDVTYFARTLAEHEANIRNHCKEKCTIL